MADVQRIPVALGLEGLGDDARAAFDLAAQAGYRGIAIATNHPQLRPEDLGDTARRHLRKILHAHSLGIESIRIAGPRGGLSDPAAIERTVDRARAGIRLAFELGVGTIVVNAGNLTADTPASATVQAAQILASEADKTGISVVFSGNSTPKLRTLLTQIAFDRARLNLEPAQLIAAGEDPLAETTHSAGTIGQLTCADAIRAGRNQVRAVEFAQGQVPWEELLALLQDADFQGPMVVDVRDLPHGPTGALHAAAVLRKLLPPR